LARWFPNRPLSFGSWHDLHLAWDHVASFENGIIFTWLANSAIHSSGALAITLVTAAGHGLALTEFIGRKTRLTITLIVMLMPSAAHWNNFFLPLVMLPTDQTAPIQVGLNNLLASSARTRISTAFIPAAGPDRRPGHRACPAAVALVAMVATLSAVVIQRHRATA
jgi:ABC-type glycerol-3-phosphate transport system permease component